MKTLDQAENLFKDLVWKAIVKAALTKLFAALPGLAWGPVGWIVTQLVTKFADYLFEQMKEFINFEAIAFKNKELQTKFDSSSLELKLIAINQGVDSDDFKKAREKHVIDLSNLVRFDVAR